MNRLYYLNFASSQSLYRRLHLKEPAISKVDAAQIPFEIYDLTQTNTNQRTRLENRPPFHPRICTLRRFPISSRSVQDYTIAMSALSNLEIFLLISDALEQLSKEDDFSFKGICILRRNGNINRSMHVKRQFCLHSKLCLSQLLLH